MNSEKGLNSELGEGGGDIEADLPEVVLGAP